ncbi:MAG: tetraacyldisaccharide 4'-kinase [Bacteroidetes bacterium]|nr:tetraacyldisaccharide 4'-kinase [Bacteroidota bacterium]
MKFLRIILFPATLFYAVIIRLRNLFFEKKIFQSKKVSAKIISVGNITVGGSGKTPMVIYLSKLLKNEGKKVGVLSRGYGRRSMGYILVSKDEQILTSVDLCGDEIYQTVIDCKIPAAVSEDRVYGAERMTKETNVNIIVLDDAFQHRWIERDVNLLLCEQSFLYDSSITNMNLLPTGIMREPFESISRADAVIINRKFSEKKDIPFQLKKYFMKPETFHAQYKSIGFVDVKKKNVYSIKEFEGQKSLVVSGIANPYSFINALKQTNVDTQNQIIFRDHKNYTLKEIQKIRKKFYSTNSHSVVTTEKDAVKFSKYTKELDDIDIYYLKIEIEIDEIEKFRTFVLNKIN